MGQASSNALPGLNAGTFAAAILIVSPVCGFRPSRAARSRTENVPKPTSETLSPLLSASVTDDSNASSARVAAALEMSAFDAILSISCDLFTLVSLLVQQFKCY